MKYSNIESMLKDRAWTRPNSYSGPDHNDTIAVLSRGRDSDLLTESNFEVALERLGGESETVEVVRDSHWACGWVETIRVSKRDRKALKEVKAILNSLAEYAALDDDDYFERERDGLEASFDDNKERFIENAIRELTDRTDVPACILEALEHSKAFEAMVHEAFIESAAYSGYDDAWIDGNFVKRFLDAYEGRYANEDLNLMRASLKQALGVA